MMLRETRGPGILIVLLIVLFLFIGCGGDDGPMKSNTGTKKDGRVYVRNDTNRIIGVRYYNEELGQTFETEVPAYAKQEDVSQAVIEGGTKVKFHIEPRVSGSQEFEVEITIDDSRTIWIQKISRQGVGQPEYEII